jgi:hypothetical protein
MPVAKRDLPAAIAAIVAAAALLLLIALGSRGFRDFDAALIGYATAAVFAAAAIVFRYARWITRPPTWRYFTAGWLNFLSPRNLRGNLRLIPIAIWTDILGQTFIARRGRLRWVMHMAIFSGVVLSLLITLPLTFGWLRFTLVPPDLYLLWFFGFPLFTFPTTAGTGFAIFHGLDYTALLLVLGVSIALWRRLHDVGLLTTQRFGFDLVPLVLLLGIAVTGLALTASSLRFHGVFYWFISLTHQVMVVSWLLSIPFGKFFHIVQRPASIGVTLYQAVNQGVALYGAGPVGPSTADQHCQRCGVELPSRRFIADLEATLADLGQDYDLGTAADAERGKLQDYCPTCKRALRGEAYYQFMGKRFL